MILRLRVVVVLSCAFLAMASPRQTHADIVVAENLLVDLRVDDIAPGATSWLNNGSLGGSFSLVGQSTPGAMVNNFGASGVPGVVFTGAEPGFPGTAFQGPAAPAGITGAGTRSIEVWAFNPGVENEETLVSWGRRGGPNGSNLSFNYGSNGTFGAVGHWGAPDMGWNGTPVAGEWHHLAYTYDGSAVRVYQDGLLKNIRGLALNTHGLGAGAGSSTNPYTITVGAQNIDPVPNLEPGLRLSGAMTFVRVHEGALSTDDVRNNFLEDADAFGVTPPTPPPPPPAPFTPEIMPRGPKHRYSFNGDANDSVGGAHGTVVNPSGLDASFSTVPGQLDLRANNNLSSNQDFSLPTTRGAFVDLPNGIISALGAGGPAQATFEAWVNVETNRMWARIFDFGKSNVGENTSGGADMSNYIFLTPQGGANATRLGSRANPGTGFTESIVDDGRVLPTGGEHHIAVVWDEVAGTQTMYVDGQRLTNYVNNMPNNEIARSSSSPILANGSLAMLQDLNNFLGRAQWPDPLFDGLFNEFRIYDYALTGNQVNGNFVAGPDVVNAIPEPATVVGALAGGLILLALRRRRRA
jgi:hypothetical protein